MNLKKLIAVVPFLLLLVGCAVQLNEEGRRIRFADAPDVVGCEQLGLVEGAGIRRNLTYAQNDLKNQAAAMGATHVIIVDRSRRGDWVAVTGKAYRCGPPAAGAEDRDKRPVSLGTGWVAGPGLVVTNNHVVKGKTDVELIGGPNRTWKGKVAERDAVNDVALIRVKSGPPLPPAIPLAGPSARVGSDVFTIGYPHATIMGGNPKVTNGIVSSTTGIKDDPRVYQVTVPMQAGNSGGPLLNGNGEAIGITSFKLHAARMYRWTGDMPENVNYAVKIKFLKALLGNASSGGGSILPRKRGSLEELAARVKKSVFIVVAE